MNTLKKLALALLASPLLVAAPAQAAGPLANCDDGVPYLWPNGGRNITWNADLGGLGNLTKAEADEFVATSFDEWTNVASSTISFVQGPDLPVDVDETNFLEYYEATAPDGLSAIVYDDTGAIFELLFGVDSGVLGFAGPEFGDPATCTISEGLAFLNGPEFVDPLAALSIMVHEFGHFSNLAHAQTNGGILLGIAVGEPEPSGPAPSNTFGAPTVADFASQGLLETMYPFFFGSGFGEEELGLDDIVSVSRLYPEADYLATTATVQGSIFAPNGTTRISGINVIARNVADPFLDAVSALSGDFTDEVDPAVSAVVGTYEFTGLTPGAQYAVYVDGILDGGFSTPPRSLPGPEEFHSGAAESNSDAPGTYVAVSAAAGATRSGVNVIFNVPREGDPLLVGDDGFVELFTPFPIDFCGERFTSLFVNANGSVTFGRPDSTYLETTRVHLSGPPRIAGLWDDLNASAAGTVTFEESGNTFTVRWDGVPEYPAVGANTFSITLNRKNFLGELLGPVAGNPFSISYGSLSAADGLAGFSCGGGHTSGYEEESDLSAAKGAIGGLVSIPAIFEDLVGTTPGETVDLRGTLRFNGVNRIVDLTEIRRNDSIARATPLLRLPFDSANPAFATVIDPERDDVDYYSFPVKAGDVLAIEVVRGDLDSVIGVFDADTGELLAVDDDGGNGLLSRLILQAQEDLRLAVAVSTYPDLEFIGVGESKGRYSLYVNTYRGTPLDLGDDDSAAVALVKPFKFNGVNYDSVFVNSNGSLSFGNGDPSYDANVPDFLAGPPRIAPLWTDFDPTGFLGNPGLVLVDGNARPATVHFISVSEFFSSDPNYFTTELHDRFGGVAIKWGPTARGEGIVGVTQGGGVTDPGEIDLSRHGLRAIGTNYENFEINTSTKGVSDFDLFFDELYSK